MDIEGKFIGESHPHNTVGQVNYGFEKRPLYTSEQLEENPDEDSPS